MTAAETFHVLRGTKYAGGGWTVTGPEVDGWLPVANADRASSWFARPADLFTTEADARAEASARRRPRRARTPRPLYGDFAALAMLHGIATDGTGRSTRTRKNPA